MFSANIGMHKTLNRRTVARSKLSVGNVKQYKENDEYAEVEENKGFIEKKSWCRLSREIGKWLKFNELLHHIEILIYLLISSNVLIYHFHKINS